MLIDLTKSHYGSISQNIPEIKLHNMYVTENPLSVSGYSYVTRPVISNFVDFTDEPVRGIYYQQGFANNRIMIVAGDIFYTINDNGSKNIIGIIEGTDICQFASTIYGVAIISGGVLYIYDGIVITEVLIPDAETPTSVTSLNNYFIISVQNSNKFFWINPGETVVDPLSFASAEANADDITAVKAISDELWIVGKETTEVWAISGDANAPFLRISGRIFNKGCISVQSVTEGVADNLPCLVWVSNNKEVLLAQGSPVKISNPFVEEVLRDSSAYHGWFFQRQRNDFYVLTTNVMTLVFDLTNQVWYRWSTINQDTWKISGGVQKNENLFGVNLLNPDYLYKLVDGYIDGNQDSLVCEVTGFVSHTSRTKVACGFVDLVANSGFSSTYSTEPIVELRWSDDQGVNWSPYVQASLGLRGLTESVIRFRSLGSIKMPGRRFEFRFSLAEPFRLDYALMNGEK